MKKYIITDPCYIIEREQYDAIGNGLGWMNFTNIGGSTLNREGGGTFILHKIKGTPNGDGSTEHNGQRIGVDAGMLCIAESEQGWEKEQWGATFETLNEARQAFQKIIRRF